MGLIKGLRPKEVERSEITRLWPLFYSFNTLYNSDTYKKNKIKLIGVDMDMAEYSCWGNHVTGINNPNSANLNVIQNICSNNYYSKYCGSVVLQIISYYNYDISNLSDEAKMILLCIDSTYLMYGFNPNNCKKWLVNILELPELYELCIKHTKQEFEELQIKYNLKKKIFVQDGELKTGIDLEGLNKLFNLSFILPKNNFIESLKYKDVGVNTYNYNNYVKKLNDNGYKVFTQAQTNKTFIKLSYEI
ncbi:hypothetical protein OSC52_00250 [Clostridium pasteurianum]|uniref:hypothetical protein n=1 Tax=Clostridium pasteurianum TaxID=1501 RepID=UPI002260A9BE|nr:hypothetical protein [Clostridium pasteurianum]UZW14337.1 hypothetical protein OSC52_00250 [Clostridium pasteurianum]